MREFNTFGPVNPQLHYHVDRAALKAEIKGKIEKGRCLTLKAAPQTGKSTLFQEAMGELTQQGGYLGVLLKCKSESRHTLVPYSPRR